MPILLASLKFFDQTLWKPVKFLGLQSNLRSFTVLAISLRWKYFLPTTSVSYSDSILINLFIQANGSPLIRTLGMELINEIGLRSIRENWYFSKNSFSYVSPLQLSYEYPPFFVLRCLFFISIFRCILLADSVRWCFLSYAGITQLTLAFARRKFRTTYSVIVRLA